MQWQADGRHAEVNCTAGRPDSVDGLRDLAAAGFTELAEVVFGPPDELPESRDLLVRRHGLGPGPVVEVQGRPDPFPGLQQAVEIAAKLGQIRRIGPEVTAAKAAEPERAGLTVGFDVGGSEHVPNGTAAWPTAIRWCSLSSRARAWPQTRFPPLSSWKAARVSTAARVRFAVVR